MIHISLEDGNSSVVIALVAGEISRIAAEYGVAALVPHHLSKGAAGEIDDRMGGDGAARHLPRHPYPRADGCRRG